MKKLYKVDVNNTSYISIHTSTLNGDVLIKKGEHVKLELNEEQFDSFYSTVTTSPFLKDSVKVKYDVIIENEENETQEISSTTEEVVTENKQENIQETETIQDTSSEIAEDKQESSNEQVNKQETEQVNVQAPKKRGRPKKTVAPANDTTQLIQEIEVVSGDKL